MNQLVENAGERNIKPQNYFVKYVSGPRSRQWVRGYKMKWGKVNRERELARVQFLRCSSLVPYHCPTCTLCKIRLFMEAQAKVGFAIIMTLKITTFLSYLYIPDV